MGFRFNTERIAKKAREEAEAKYNAQRNLRPVEAPPAALLEALEGVARDLGGLRWITLGEYKADGDRVSRLLVGVRLGPGAPADFRRVEGAVVAAIRQAIRAAVRVEVVELDADVDETMADGSENPYVVVKPG
jgi:hypothetical protein